MVQQGDFLVEIVEAESKVSFKEHTRSTDGKVFAEVEPDIEYFVHIKRTGENDYKGDVVSASILVDGQDMGVSYPWSKGRRHSLYAGLWKCKDGVATTTALKVFEPPQRVKGSSTQGRNYVTGKVEVQIFERIFSGTYYQLSEEKHSTEFKNCRVLECSKSDRKKDKKLLRSKVGSTEVTETFSPGRQPQYHRGKLLDTITLQYCSTVGLIEVGILQRPASWGPKRRRPCSDWKEATTGATTVTVTPPAVAPPLLKKIRVETIITSQESTFIDLCASDNEEEEHQPPKSLFSS
jgi:hypothetical protein